MLFLSSFLALLISDCWATQFAEPDGLLGGMRLAANVLDFRLDNRPYYGGEMVSFALSVTLASGGVGVGGMGWGLLHSFRSAV